MYTRGVWAYLGNWDTGVSTTCASPNAWSTSRRTASLSSKWLAALITLFAEQVSTLFYPSPPLLSLPPPFSLNIILAKGEMYSFGHGEYGQHGGVANYSDWGSGEAVSTFFNSFLTSPPPPPPMWLTSGTGRERSTFT